MQTTILSADTYFVEHGTSNSINHNGLDIAGYLEQVTVLLIDVVNSRSRAHLEQVVEQYHAPSLILGRSVTPGLGTVAASDREAYIDGILAYTAAYNFRMQPQNITALVDEANGTARVFATVTATGTEEAGDGVSNESVLIYYFERLWTDRGKSCKWMVVRLEFIRGPGNHFV